jgi:hypothetical protein
MPVSTKTAHLQIYLDGKIIRDERVIDIGATPGIRIITRGHDVDNGDFVPMSMVLTAQLSRCPFDDDGVCEHDC